MEYDATVWEDEDFEVEGGEEFFGEPVDFSEVEDAFFATPRSLRIDPDFYV